MYLDNCRVCGKRVTDFEDGGYESESGQRGHFACDKATGVKVDDLRFINALNETAVTFLSDLADWGWNDEPAHSGRLMSGPGYEAYSAWGEIRAFRTFSEANAWRVSTVLERIGS